MTRYIALLRGVNVGGGNKISMPALKAAFLRHGFENVVTYINSGNILFDSALTSQAAKSACEDIIAADFGLQITVGIFPSADLAEALAHAPNWWNSGKDAKHNAIFVIPPATAEEVVASVGDIKPEYERVAHHGNIIFWSAPLATFSHTRWSKIVGNKAVYRLITIRNANTAQKLAALAKT